MNIVFRNGKLNDRCIGCQYKHAGMDWCTKWNENPNYCLPSCIEKYPICMRDNPEIHRQIQLYLYQKFLKTDCKD
jgi:hypothetical protein